MQWELHSDRGLVAIYNSYFLAELRMVQFNDLARRLGVKRTYFFVPAKSHKQKQ